MRRAARAILTLLLAISLALCLWSGWSLATGWPGSIFVDAGAARIEAELTRQLARAAGDGRMVARLDALLDEAPRNWMAIDAVAEELARQNVALPPELEARRASLRAADTGTLKMAGACLRCARNVADCDLSAALLCGAAVQLSPVGDVQSLAREGRAYLRGDAVDRVDVLLSALGLSAVVLVPLTGGSSSAVKLGAGLAKLAHGMGRLPTGLTRTLEDSARNGLDWQRLADARSVADLKALMRPERLRPTIDLLKDGGRMKTAVGLADTLHLLDAAEDAGDLRRLANIAEAAPTRSIAGLEVLGKSRLLRLATRLSDAAAHLLAALAGLLASLIGLFHQALVSAVLRRLRRAAQD
ncbi:hypothetical protein NHN26_08385 [Rhodovulum tesquicola]|uniref:hypothetical protein n=1 Tax=Rhodovulum tesquicola TaxID=540254 RepID=UPI0020982AF4|nr:hypothetical protein [Rhodovulum tesquicola]MCO8145242.1 hypothetical protein [Rhodovulum tesquicola]